MTILIDEPLLTTSLYRREFQCAEDSLYIFASNGEERSIIDRHWRGLQEARNVDFLTITTQSIENIVCEPTSTSKIAVELGSKKQVQRLIGYKSHSQIYLDITGIDHHVWAPIVRACLDSGARLEVVYVEPGSYALSETPQRGSFFDLNATTLGISPIPTFAYLRDSDDKDVLLVPRDRNAIAGLPEPLPLNASVRKAPR